MGRPLLLITVFLATLLAAAHAAARTPVVDASNAEAQYRKGQYREAREGFEEALEKFRKAPKDSSDRLVYREAAYLYDRTADCAFTMRDWEGLKHNLDGLLVVNMSERNYCQSQLAGAVGTGVGRALGKYLMDQLDEAVRMSSLTQLKRSISLVLVDKGGSGPASEEAIRLYQQLVGILQKVLLVEEGAFFLDVPELEKHIEEIEAIDVKLKKLADIEALWEKYKPEGTGADAVPATPAAQP